MNGGKVEIGMQMTQKDGDIAKADDPFGLCLQRREIQRVDDVYGTIAAAGAEDGGEFGITKHLLEVCRAFLVGAAEDKIFFTYGVADLDAKAPAFDEVYRRLNLLGGDVACGTRDADDVAVSKKRRNKQGERVRGRGRCGHMGPGGVGRCEYGSCDADGQHGR